MNSTGGLRKHIVGWAPAESCLGGTGRMGDYDVDMDCDMDDAVAFSQEDWTNGETTEDMEWDTAVLEAALHDGGGRRHRRDALGPSAKATDHTLDSSPR